MGGLPPSLAGDSVAIRTRWDPLVGGGANFRTRNLVTVNPARVEFPASLGMRLFAGAFLLLQGVVEIIRCAICLKQGQWPSREEDVEEVDVDKLKKLVHVNEENVENPDELMTQRRGPDK